MHCALLVFKMHADPIRSWKYLDYLQVYIPVFFMVLPKDLDCRWNSSKTFFNFFNPGPGQKTRKTMLDFTTLTRSSCQFFK